MSKIVKKKDLDVLIESTLKKAGIETIKEFTTQPNDDQKLAEKILSVIKNNPEKVRNLTPYPQNDHHSYIAYNFYLGDSPNLIHIRAENPKGFSSKVSEYRYVLLMGKPNSYHIKCSSKTAKEIFETISNLDSGSRNNFLQGLGESTLKKAGIDSNVVKQQVTSVNGQELSDEEMDNIKSAIEMSTKDKTDKNKKTVKKESTSSDKSLINEELMRFNKLTNYTYKK